MLDDLAFWWFRMGLRFFGNRFVGVATDIVIETLADGSGDLRIRYHAGRIGRFAQDRAQRRAQRRAGDGE